MDSIPNTPANGFSAVGFILAVIAGVIGAVGIGYVYFFVANKIGIDIIIVMALFLGFGVGWVVGTAARIGRLRAVWVLIPLGLVFGVAAYAARYWFEFSSVGASGGYFGYLASIAERGFGITDRYSRISTIQGTFVWVTFGLEAFFAAVTSIMAAVTTARQQPLFSR